MSKFFDNYQERCEILRDECDKMVASGELSQDDADFRYNMIKDEILYYAEDK
jgi:hypothetical protein